MSHRSQGLCEVFWVVMIPLSRCQPVVENCSFRGLPCCGQMKELSSLGSQPHASLLAVIFPLNSLISNQISSCERTGIEACKVKAENTTSFVKEMRLSHFICKPGGFRSSREATNIISNTEYCDHIIEIVIDESHC